MEQATRDTVDAIIAKETWTASDYQELQTNLFAMGDAVNKFKEMLASLESANPSPSGDAALKIGIARFMVCRFTTGLEALSAATDNKERHYFAAACHRELRQYDLASEALSAARQGGWDAVEIDKQLLELQALSGDLNAAAKSLAKLEKKIADTACYHYLDGLIKELTGQTDAAGDAYEKAIELDPTHVRATFHLAYYCDLHGEEDRALELYTECLNHPPVHANALLNLAVLYEDRGQYDRAVVCLKRVLAVNPNHLRAKLFLKDVEAAKTMYYDEDQAKRIAKRNAVLDIPVTDFELSVRARNCLKKMNIRSLGDLVNTTEPALLSYKNFGETSLKEIKDMLKAKNLHLGQALEEDSGLAPAPKLELVLDTEDSAAMGLELEKIEFSVRARRALEGLNISTLGELAAKSEAELLGCRNFGQTSLNEIRQRLTENGLSFRENN